MKFTTRVTGSLLILFLLAGCGAKTTVCPTYPKPSQHVLERLKSLKDSEVDQWLIKQYKLNKQLGVCNGKY